MGATLDIYGCTADSGHASGHMGPLAFAPELLSSETSPWALWGGWTADSPSWPLGLHPNWVGQGVAPTNSMETAMAVRGFLLGKAVRGRLRAHSPL